MNSGIRVVEPTNTKSFGFAGRPAGGHDSFATVADISSNYQITPAFALNMSFAHVYGKSVVAPTIPQVHPLTSAISNSYTDGTS